MVTIRVPVPKTVYWGGVMAGKNLPSGSTAEQVVGFRWNARQGGSFSMPYTNVARLDAETLAVIDNPVLFNYTVAYFYADFALNDRGGLGGVMSMAGTDTHPAFVTTLVDRDAGVPPPWTLFGVRFGDDSP